MISLRKKPAPSEPSPADAARPTDGKGHPTPKRRDAEAANKRPLVPADRKEAARLSRERERAARARTQEAMLTGDERYLPARDKGPVRRYTRDYIDARWNIGEFFLPISVGALLFVVFMGGNESLARFALVAIFVLYGVVLGSIVDILIATQRLKRRIAAKFGAVPRGTLAYAAMRAYQMRRMRMPRPQVGRGQYPA